MSVLITCSYAKPKPFLQTCKLKSGAITDHEPFISIKFIVRSLNLGNNNHYISLLLLLLFFIIITFFKYDLAFHIVSFKTEYHLRDYSRKN